MPGVGFDRATSFYDATRGLPTGVPEQVRDQIVRRTGAGQNTRFLEIGVGTGRIALPFVRIGADYTGADLSLPMMEVLRRKIAPIPEGARRLKLALADAMALPFADASFDVIIMIHLLHLVSDWQETLGECRRVLREGGWLVLSSNERAGSGTMTWAKPAGSTGTVVSHSIPSAATITFMRSRLTLAALRYSTLNVARGGRAATRPTHCATAAA